MSNDGFEQRIIPKLCGMDVELGNAILGIESSSGSGAAASRALLREVDGVSGWLSPSHASDWGRKFLASNGGCAYIDLNHFEICVPEMRSAVDLVAGWHAMLRIARAAMHAANRRLPAGQRIQVTANNSDGFSHSYGAHCNFLVHRHAWENIFERRLHFQLFLASFQASSIVYTGQGKVGAENDRPDARYQLSQRADFFETLCAVQTTYRRPIVNARDESLCGSSRYGEKSDLARLHCIFFDSSLQHVATLLKIGTMQIVLAMIEAEVFDPAVLLEDPVAAVQAWSRDPTLATRCPTIAGEMLTAVELQRRLLERAARFIERPDVVAAVPGCADIVALWSDTLDLLETGDLDALATRLDWALKLRTILDVLRENPHLDWQSPELRVLDRAYSSLDEDEGIYWACEKAGEVAELVRAERIAHFVDHPPDDTRAWTRAKLLQLAQPRSLVSVDWDNVVVWTPIGHRRFKLDNPLRSTRADWMRQCGGDPDLDDAVASLRPELVVYPPAGAQLEIVHYHS